MISHRRFRSNLFSALQAILFVGCAFYGLQAVTGSETPVVTVVSDSMEPVFSRGDLVFLRNREVQLEDIVVFSVPGKPLPIIHRVIGQHSDGQFVTKGDNNLMDDRFLYAAGQKGIHPEDIQGVAWFSLPWLGYPSLLLHEYGVGKAAVLGGSLMAILLGY